MRTESAPEEKKLIIGIRFIDLNTYSDVKNHGDKLKMQTMET